MGEAEDTELVTTGNVPLSGEPGLSPRHPMFFQRGLLWQGWAHR